MSFKDKIFKNESPWGSGPTGGGDRNGSGQRRPPPTSKSILEIEVLLIIKIIIKL